ncbi:MAG: DUF3179 domain-containing protein [Deltaproteobacteria bacterium]|nr:MAG: DUF3179 domain-containing protein [Deltaproteobacteria bacterium]
MTRSARAILLAATAAVPLAAEEPPEPAAGDALNGFSLEKRIVPRAAIEAGGPDRDAVRSVDLPSFVSPEDATWVAPGNPVLGVQQDGEAHAYPVHLLEWHQVVNDVLGDVRLAVTYDPLTGAPIAFRRRIGERTLSFGVSGLVYNSSALLYDRETESLWAPLRGEAIAGPLAGTRIDRVRVRQLPLARWLAVAPDSLVLVRPEVRRIDYRYSPFSRYWLENRIPYRVAAKDERFHAKELVLGVVVGGRARAYLGSLLTAAGGSARDAFQNEELRIRYDTNLGVFDWEAPDDVEVTESYWFAWKAFHPDTEIWHDPGTGPEAP